MATNYPNSKDSLTNPTSTDKLNSPSHSAQHANINDAVEAIQDKLGTGSVGQQAGTGHVLIGTGAGATRYRALVEADISDFGNYVATTDIDTLAELNAIITDATLVDEAHTHTESDITDLQSYLTNINSQSIKDLSDVLSSMTPSDGQVLTYDTTNGWQAENATGGASQLTDLSDVSGATTTNRFVLVANGSTFVARALTEADISDLGSYLTNVVGDTTPQLGGPLDVNGNKIVSVSSGNIDIEPNGTGNVLLGNMTFDADQSIGAGQDNYVLTYDNSSGLISLEAATGGASQLSDLSDVDSTVNSPSDGDILVYRSAGTDWVLEAKPAGGSNPAINDITDITITTVADNEVLAYDNGTSEWINQTAAEAGLASASHTHDVVSNIATSRILGRTTAGSGDSEELTAAQTRTLLNVEDGATADQTGAEIKAAYEGEANTNAFTDAEQTKLSGIETSADVTDATNVTSAGAVMADGTGNDITGDLVFDEKADHSSTPGAGHGYLWVKNTVPSTLIFTDDGGTDTTLGAGGMTSFDVSGDLGSNQTISDGNTLQIIGGTNLSSTASATDTITLNMNSSVSLTAITTDTIDVNGTADAVILDTDGDTTISAPTDDQIDMEVGGTDVVRVTGAGLTVLGGAPGTGGITTGVDGIFTNIISERTATSGVTIDGVTLKDSNIELSGGASIDAGANDVTIDSPISITFAVAGVTDFSISSNSLVAESGSSISTNTINETTAASGVTVDGVVLKDTTVDVNGTADAIILDADADTTISAPTDDQIDFEAGGTDRMSLNASGLALQSGARVNDINDEDDMVSDSATALATQQSIKAYVDSSVEESGWSSWTPSWTNVTVGNGTVYSSYTQIGKTIIAEAVVVAGTTTSFGNSISVSLPVTADTKYTNYVFSPIGNVTGANVGVAGYFGKIMFNGSTTTAVVRWDLSGGGGSFSSTFPYTEGSGDSLSLQFTYEAA